MDEYYPVALTAIKDARLDGNTGSFPKLHIGGKAEYDGTLEFEGPFNILTGGYEVSILEHGQYVGGTIRRIRAISSRT